MRELFRRFRVWVAVRLVYGTDCQLVRSLSAQAAIKYANELNDYIQHSGALLDPRRVRAHRRITRDAILIQEKMRAALVQGGPCFTSF